MIVGTNKTTLLFILINQFWVGKCRSRESNVGFTPPRCNNPTYPRLWNALSDCFMGNINLRQKGGWTSQCFGLLSSGFQRFGLNIGIGKWIYFHWPCTEYLLNGASLPKSLFSIVLNSFLFLASLQCTKIMTDIEINSYNKSPLPNWVYCAISQK